MLAAPPGQAAPLSPSASAIDITQEESSSGMEWRAGGLVLFGACGEDETLVSAAKGLGVASIKCLPSVSDWLGSPDESQDFVCILPDFEDSADLAYLVARKHRVYGPPIILECARAGAPLPRIHRNRPRFCTAMSDVVVFTTGIKEMSALKRLADLLHWMGGSIRKEFTSACTHLIASSTTSEKYRTAMSMGKMVMSESWVTDAWARRHQLGASALHPKFVEEHRLAPFFSCRVALVGFEAADEAEMRQKVIEGGGEVLPWPPSESESTAPTHIVAEDYGELGMGPESGTAVVSAAWLWTSVQLHVCALSHLYPASGAPDSTPSKRQRRAEELRRRSRRESTEYRRHSLPYTEQSSELSANGELIFSKEEEGLEESRKDLPSKRHHTCLELLNTERNYVDALRLIKRSYMAPLLDEIRKAGTRERAVSVAVTGSGTLASPLPGKLTLPHHHDHGSGELLCSKAEWHAIFGKLDPLLELHERILEELKGLILHWDEERKIGAVFSKRAEDLARVYPGFVNGHDHGKEKLRALRANPKFHAFLKAQQAKAETPAERRQDLDDLLIRPVQRLPSVALILKDILKRTGKENPDRSELEVAIAAVEKAISHINSAKAHIDTNADALQGFQDIAGLPPIVMSSKRYLCGSLDARLIRFVRKTDVTTPELLQSKRRMVRLLLFTDVCILVRQRSKPPPGGPNFKHLAYMPLYNLRRLILVKDVSGLFLMTLRIPEDIDIIFHHDPYITAASMASPSAHLAPPPGPQTAFTLAYETYRRSDAAIRGFYSAAAKATETLGTSNRLELEEMELEKEVALRESPAGTALPEAHLERLAAVEKTAHELRSSSIGRHSSLATLGRSGRLASSSSILASPSAAVTAANASPHGLRRAVSTLGGALRRMNRSALRLHNVSELEEASTASPGRVSLAIPEDTASPGSERKRSAAGSPGAAFKTPKMPKSISTLTNRLIRRPSLSQATRPSPSTSKHSQL